MNVDLHQVHPLLIPYLIDQNDMGNIETIEIRLPLNLSRILENEIAELADIALTKKEGVSVKLYNKVSLESDYLIVIYYEKSMTGKQTMDLGTKLLTSLKEYGIVCHNYWNVLL